MGGESVTYTQAHIDALTEEIAELLQMRFEETVRGDRAQWALDWHQNRHRLGTFTEPPAPDFAAQAARLAAALLAGVDKREPFTEPLTLAEEEQVNAWGDERRAGY
jgi:hypothetical protein